MSETTSGLGPAPAHMTGWQTLWGINCHQSFMLLLWSIQLETMGHGDVVWVQPSSVGEPFLGYFRLTSCRYRCCRRCRHLSIPHPSIHHIHPFIVFTPSPIQSHHFLIIGCQHPHLPEVLLSVSSVKQVTHPAFSLSMLEIWTLFVFLIMLFSLCTHFPTPSDIYLLVLEFAESINRHWQTSYTFELITFWLEITLKECSERFCPYLNRLARLCWVWEGWESFCGLVLIRFNTHTSLSCNSMRAHEISATKTNWVGGLRRNQCWCCDLAVPCDRSWVCPLADHLLHRALLLQGGIVLPPAQTDHSHCWWRC